MLHPVQDRVLVRPIIKSDERPSGLIVVEYDPGVTSGTVAACGPEVTAVMPGEVVIFPRYAGQEVSYESGVFILLAQEDISAVVTADPTECPLCSRPLEA